MNISTLTLLALISIAMQACTQKAPLQSQQLSQQTPQQPAQQQLSVKPGATPPDCVILLHGLARSSKAMRKLSEQLQLNGFLVVNDDYPSSDFPIAILAEKA